MKRTLALFILAVVASGAVPASAKPTPVPGGANQAVGVAGTFGQKLFNGEVRLTPRELRDANAADDLITPDGQKWLAFTASASNGTSQELDMSQFNASVANADGDTVQADPDKLKPTGSVTGVPPGGQWKEQIYFLVPTNFVPVKMLIVPYDGKHKAFRITIRPSDYKH